MKLQSPVFEKDRLIPPEFTCDGPDKSPPLSWTGSPAGTKSFALLVEDPDAPGGTFTHWLLYDIPGTTDHLDPDLPRATELPDGVKQGMNDFRTVGYGGPCPPGGTHRYLFKLYALDKVLGLDGGATKQKWLKSIEGHVLAKSECVGKYSRKGEKEASVDRASEESFPASDAPPWSP